MTMPPVSRMIPRPRRVSTTSAPTRALPVSRPMLQRASISATMTPHSISATVTSNRSAISANETRASSVPPFRPIENNR